MISKSWILPRKKSCSRSVLYVNEGKMLNPLHNTNNNSHSSSTCSPQVKKGEEEEATRRSVWRKNCLCRSVGWREGRMWRKVVQARKRGRGWEIRFVGKGRRGWKERKSIFFQPSWYIVAFVAVVLPLNELHFVSPL